MLGKMLLNRDFHLLGDGATSRFSQLAKLATVHERNTDSPRRMLVAIPFDECGRFVCDECSIFTTKSRVCEDCQQDSDDDSD